MTKEELRDIRQHLRVSQRELGELLGYNANYIYRLEAGEVPITRRFERLVHLVLEQRKLQKSF